MSFSAVPLQKRREINEKHGSDYKMNPGPRHQRVLMAEG